MSTSSPATFTGSSAFSASLAQQISNSLNIASIPMQNLQAQQSTLQGQQRHPERASAWRRQRAGVTPGSPVEAYLFDAAL